LDITYDEQDRIWDIVLKNGSVNWIDALGDSQIKSKLSLVEELSYRISRDDQVIILGGWIGLVPYMMNKKNISCSRVINIEIDQMALVAADALNASDSFSYDRIYTDVTQLDYSHWVSPVVINTSCEHFHSYQSWFPVIPDGTLCFLQSNNMFKVVEHLNCHENLQDFIEAVGLSKVLKTEEIDVGDGCQRFMIIGYK
jgi:hypothetical protein